MSAAEIFDAIERFKMANPWYERSLEIIHRYHEIQKAQQPRYIILTGNSSLPFRWNPDKKCYEQYQPEAKQ